MVSQSAQRKGCCLLPRPHLSRRRFSFACLSSNPALFFCFFSVSWPVILLFPGKIWPFNKTTRNCCLQGAAQTNHRAGAIPEHPTSLSRSCWALLVRGKLLPRHQNVSFAYSGIQSFLGAPRFRRQIPQEPGCRMKAMSQPSIKSQIPNF